VCQKSEWLTERLAERYMTLQINQQNVKNLNEFENAEFFPADYIENIISLNRKIHLSLKFIFFYILLLFIFSLCYELQNYQYSNCLTHWRTLQTERLKRVNKPF
jgi:hypothetical protein